MRYLRDGPDWFNGPVRGYATAADQMTIAVFTKNSTNPAYEAFRIAADQVARATGADRALRPEKAGQCR